MVVLGLTGGIGSGKSTVAALLEARGAHVIDADRIVRELQEPGEPVFEAIVERFGPGVVAVDGSLDRKAVADIVFNDDEALADLNAIVHPEVGAELMRRLDEVLSSAGDHGVVVLDVPLLVEAKDPPDLAGVIVVDAEPEVAIRRLVDQRGLTEADARARLAHQASREERLAKADFVVANHGSLQDLEEQVDRCWEWASRL